MNNQNFDELIDMYEDALKEAQSLWLSDYCCSRKEAETRQKEDEEKMKEFISICNKIRGKNNERMYRI